MLTAISGLAMLTAVYGVTEGSLWLCLSTAVLVLMGLFACLSVPVPQPSAKVNYGLIRLESGVGWASPEEAMRAHLLGSWLPRHMSPPDLRKTEQGILPFTQIYITLLIAIVVCSFANPWATALIGCVALVVMCRIKAVWKMSPLVFAALTAVAFVVFTCRYAIVLLPLVIMLGCKREKS